MSDQMPAAPAKKSSWRRVLASPYTWMIVGLLGVALAEPVRNIGIRKWCSPEGNVATVAQESENPCLRRWDLGAYVLEHLAAVIFVAMLIRLAIEKRAQEEAVEGVSDAVKAEVKKAFVDVNAEIEQFNTKVGDVKNNLTSVDERLSTIQVVTGGSLYAQKLKHADREKIAETFLDPVFFRPRYDLTVRLTAKEQDLLNVQIEIDSRLQNISKVPQSLIITAFLDNVLFRQGTTNVATESKFHRFEFGPDTEAGRELARRQPFHVSEEGNERFISKVGDNLVFTYDPQIKIPVGETFFVKVLAEQQMRSSDLFVWIMQAPTENFNIKVNLEGNLTKENFTVIARPMHHVQHESLAPKQDSDNKTLSWSIETVVLPYQGVQLWWSPKGGESEPAPKQHPAA